MKKPWDWALGSLWAREGGWTFALLGLVTAVPGHVVIEILRQSNPIHTEMSAFLVILYLCKE